MLTYTTTGSIICCDVVLDTCKTDGTNVQCPTAQCSMSLVRGLSTAVFDIAFVIVHMFIDCIVLRVSVDLYLLDRWRVMCGIYCRLPMQPTSGRYIYQHDKCTFHTFLSYTSSMECWLCDQCHRTCMSNFARFVMMHGNVIVESKRGGRVAVERRASLFRTLQAHWFHVVR